MLFDPVTILGIIGTGIILVFFVLNQARVLSSENVWYDVFNTIGGLILITYSFIIGSIPFIILNAVWTFVSVKDVIQYFAKKRNREVLH